MNTTIKKLAPNASEALPAHWMPFSANRDFRKAPRMIVKSEGMYLWNQHGDRLIDGSSGLFNAALGNSRPEIAEAVYAQMQQNAFSVPFQVGHPLSFELASTLADLLPGALNRVFFTSSGSEAVDTALKLVMAYHHARGEGRRDRFVSRERAYHGANISGVSLSGMIKNREAFNVVMPNVVLMRHTWDPAQCFSRGEPERGAELADDLQRFVDVYGGKTLAAVIVEPVAGSTGTLVPPKGYLQRLRDICDRHGILLIFDEVITGFGRLGHPFAGQCFGVEPDIVTMAKALSNGAIPMGAVAVSDRIFETIAGTSGEQAIEFFHGYTSSAHPAACAAALTTLKLLKEESAFERAAAMSDYFLDALWSLRDLPVVRDIRGIGMLGAVEVHPDAQGAGVRGTELHKRLFWNGCQAKWTGDSAIVAPALIAEKGHIDEIIACFRKTLQTA